MESAIGAAIRDALETESIKWKTLVHLFLITGARRGEILGLKWDKADFAANRIFICNNILYSSDNGYRLAKQVQHPPRPAPYQPPRLPPHGGLHAVLQRGGQRIHFQAAGTRSGVNHGQYLRPCYGRSRPTERGNPVGHFLEKGIGFSGKLN